MSSGYGPLQLNGIGLLDLPFLSLLKPIASTYHFTSRWVNSLHSFTRGLIVNASALAKTVALRLIKICLSCLLNYMATSITDDGIRIFINMQ
jgi:hypothetical protein